ncbi:hypothetical protein AALB39_08920 [Lachnospiraceae bacterium 54-53]
MKQKKKPSTTLIQTVPLANTDLTKRFSPKVRRSLKVTGTSWTANIFVGLGKLSMGCVHAILTISSLLLMQISL